MFKVKLIQKTINKNGDSKREVKSEKQIKKNDNYQSLINELSKTFNIPINKIILLVLTEDEDFYPINDQEDLDSYIDEAKEFQIIYEIDSIQNKKFNFNLLNQDNYPKKELTLKGKDNKLYNLMIIKEQDKIIFKSNAINNIWDIQYSTNVNIKGFYEINKIFRKYNSINEIYSKYFNDIKEEQIDISSSDNKIIVYFSDNNEVKLSFILEPNEMKMDNIIRKLCDRMEDVEIELDIQKIENASLKKELERRINDDEKTISELKKEIENLKKSINSSRNQEELYDNKLEDIIKEINEMKKVIDKQNKNKKGQGFQEIIEESKINDFSIVAQEKKLELIGGINDISSDEEEDIDDDYHQPIFIQFEKDEIKYEINNKKPKFFEIKNIKITNISSKEYNKLYFVIDTNISSKNLLFDNFFSIDTYQKITLDEPLQKGESLNNKIDFFFNGQEFREYTLFIYVRENINGENLSLPLKIIVHPKEDPEEIRKREEAEEERKKEKKKKKREIEKEEEDDEIKKLIETNLNINFKGLNKKRIYQIYIEIDNEYNVRSLFDIELIIKTIIENNCDRDKILKWIEDNL